MNLTVQQRGDNVATFRWIEVRLMETLAAWVPTTPEMEVKLVFGAHIWDTAQHADMLGKRWLAVLVLFSVFWKLRRFCADLRVKI